MARFEVTVINRMSGISRKTNNPFYMVQVKDQDAASAYTVFCSESIFKSCDPGTKHVCSVDADFNGRASVTILR